MVVKARGWVVEVMEMERSKQIQVILRSKLSGTWRCILYERDWCQG